MAQTTDDQGLDKATSPEKLREQMELTRQSLSKKLAALKQYVLGAVDTPMETRRRNMPAQKTRGSSNVNSAKPTQKAGTKKSASSTTRGRKSATSNKSSKASSSKKSKQSSSITKKVTKVMGDVLTAAAQGAVKGAVQAAIPPVEKAVGIEETSDTKEGSASRQPSKQSAH